MHTIHLPSTQCYRPSEVYIYVNRPLFNTMVFLNCSRDVDYTLRTIIAVDRLDYKEFFWVLLLSRANALLGFSEIGSGDDTGVVVNHKEIFQLILRINATNFIVAHNHPSGKLKPSASDIQQTKRIVGFADLLGVSLLDHLILTSEGYLSFADEGLL